MGSIADVRRRRGKSVRPRIGHITDPACNPFFAAIAANPTDRLTRLVFADFLDERGDAVSANWSRYIRLVCSIWEGIDLNRQFLARGGEASRLRDLGPDGVRELNRIATANDREKVRLDLARWYQASGHPRRAEFVRLQIKNTHRAPTVDQENREYDLLLAVWREWLPPETSLLKKTADERAGCCEGDWGGARLRIPTRRIVGRRITNPKIWITFESGLPITVRCDRIDYVRIHESLRFRFPWLEFKPADVGLEDFEP